MFGVAGGAGRRPGARLRLPARRRVSTVFELRVVAGLPEPESHRRAPNIEQFLLAFDTGLKPGGRPAGVDRRRPPSTPRRSSTASTCWSRVPMPAHCDLVVKGNDRAARRAARSTSAATTSSSTAMPTRRVTTTALRNLAATAGQELTFTCVPPGTGTRIGVDRDLDGVFDRRELDCGTDPANPASFPPTLTGSCGGTTTTTSPSTTTTTTHDHDRRTTTTTTTSTRHDTTHDARSPRRRTTGGEHHEHARARRPRPPCRRRRFVLVQRRDQACATRRRRRIRARGR